MSKQYIENSLRLVAGATKIAVKKVLGVDSKLPTEKDHDRIVNKIIVTGKGL